MPASQLTSVLDGSLLGSPAYMSPQQDNGEPASVTDDIYAAGATIYDLLTGKPPFYSGNISRQIHEKNVPAMEQRRRELNVEGRQPIPAAWGGSGPY